MREVREESGLTDVRPASPAIYSVEILPVSGHEKRGIYVPSHLHLNVTYLLEADPASPVRCKPDENSSVAWFGLEEAVAASAEPWFRERVYSKLNAKLAAFPGQGDGPLRRKGLCSSALLAATGPLWYAGDRRRSNHAV